MEAITNGMMNLNRQRHQHLVALRIIFAHGENGGEEVVGDAANLLI